MTTETTEATTTTTPQTGTSTPQSVQDVRDTFAAYDITHASSNLMIAQGRFEREKAALYRADGQQRYSDTEHAERLGALHATLDAVIGEAQETAEGVISAQQTLLQHLEQGDLLDSLYTSEQTAASARQVFIKEDAESLPVADLVTRCRIALTSGDKPTAYLLARYVGQRVAAADKAGTEGRQPEMDGDERRLLGDLVRELRAKVQGPEGAKKVEAAKALQSKALELRSRTRAAYDAAHDRPAALEAQLRATGRYSL